MHATRHVNTAAHATELRGRRVHHTHEPDTTFTGEGEHSYSDAATEPGAKETVVVVVTRRGTQRGAIRHRRALALRLKQDAAVTNNNIILRVVAPLWKLMHQSVHREAKKHTRVGLRQQAAERERRRKQAWTKPD